MSLSYYEKQDISPFHEGEQKMQDIARRRKLTERIGRRFIRPFLTEEHQEFFRGLSYLFLSARDEDGWPQPFILHEDSPFITVPDEEHLVLHSLVPGLEEGQRVGLLGLDFSNRRRNRVNGHVAAREEDHVILRVDQAFGNCPKYIDIREMARPPLPGPESIYNKATPEIRDMIRESRRFFIASGYDTFQNNGLSGMDISHRGGAPGFVQVHAPDRLIFPEYAGNNYFNTLGNILMDGRAGLLFANFDTGARLRVLGNARVIFNNFEETGWQAQPNTPEAKRLVQIEIEKVLHAPGRVGPVQSQGSLSSLSVSLS
ncbi:pyridoxamine 5'-phosphate oxidase family protein [Emcibacter sp.]|uniref:pyridoxamine 5'-phosphate oxidase family protein n=1 Tax=Emcibacter sp. TaxID=1979954 RepID=UPI003A93E4BA